MGLLHVCGDGAMEHDMAGKFCSLHGFDWAYAWMRSGDVHWDNGQE